MDARFVPIVFLLPQEWAKGKPLNFKRNQVVLVEISGIVCIFSLAPQERK
jgi:hypothetical protein